MKQISDYPARKALGSKRPYVFEKDKTTGAAPYINMTLNSSGKYQLSVIAQLG